VSTSDGDASSRLDNALAEVFAGAPGVAGADDWHVDDIDDEPTGPVALPEIVPATVDVPEPTAAAPAAQPTVPAAAPNPAVAAPAAAGARPPLQPTAPATGWADHMTNLPANAQGAALRAPGRRPRVRRVTRVLRHIDPWSTFKVALLFSVVAYLVSLTSGVLLWRVADSTGTLDNVERWFTQFGWETFELKGGEIFHNAWIIGLFGAVALTGGLVLLATLFNLVSDIVGGVRMTVLEEEVVERTVSSTRRYVVRRTPVAGAAGGDDWDVDGGDTPDDAAAGRASAVTAATPTVPNDDWSVDDDDEVDGEVDDAEAEVTRNEDSPAS
jgi:Transmembrane domain of unknown function (DUF3566)